MSGPLLAGFSIPYNVKNIMGSYSSAQKAAKGRDRALAYAGMMTEMGNPLDKLIAYRKQSQISPAFQEAQIEKLAGDNYRQNEFMTKMLEQTKQQERAKTIEKATTTSRDISSGIEMRTSNRLQPGDFQSQFLQGVVVGRGQRASENPEYQQQLSELLEQGRQARRSRPPPVFGQDWRSVTGVPRDISAVEAGSYVMERGNDPMLRGEQARFGEGLSFEEIYRQGEASGSLMTELFEQQAPPELGTLEVAGGGARARRRARLERAGQMQMEGGTQMGMEEQVMQSMYGGGGGGGGAEAGGGAGAADPGSDIRAIRDSNLSDEEKIKRAIQARPLTMDEMATTGMDLDMMEEYGSYLLRYPDGTFQRFLKMRKQVVSQASTFQGTSGFEGGSVRRL